MSSDLILGAFGDISKVQHQIEASLNNNCVSIKQCAQQESHTAEKVKDDACSTTEPTVPKKELYKCGKQERAKMLADGYTTGIPLALNLCLSSS